MTRQVCQSDEVANRTELPFASCGSMIALPSSAIVQFAVQESNRTGPIKRSLSINTHHIAFLVLSAPCRSRPLALTLWQELSKPTILPAPLTARRDPSSQRPNHVRCPRQRGNDSLALLFPHFPVYSVSSDCVILLSPAKTRKSRPKCLRFAVNRPSASRTPSRSDPLFPESSELPLWEVVVLKRRDGVLERRLRPERGDGRWVRGWSGRADNNNIVGKGVLERRRGRIQRYRRRPNSKEHRREVMLPVRWRYSLVLQLLLFWLLLLRRMCKSGSMPSNTSTKKSK